MDTSRPVHEAPYLRAPLDQAKGGAQIKTVKKSAPCAAFPLTASKRAPSLRSVARTAKMLDRSDSAPGAPDCVEAGVLRICP